MSLKPGTQLGPYEVIEAIGAGGMGEVFKAKDTRLDRIVAIKILNIHIAANPDLKARFEREAKAISSLNHPHICTLYDIGNDNGTDYLVMEYIEGDSLSERLKNGPLTLPETLTIASQIADALDKAHRQGLIHRDLKPGNIMLTKEGAKLLDFGLAKLSVEGGSPGLESITQTTPLTGAGTLIGTMQYMAPEQLEGNEADQRSDIFSFGAVLYEMATGARPFKGGSQASLIASILKEEPRSVSEVLPAVPPMLEETVSQCLAKDPDQRWQSAGDLKRALLWIAEGKIAPKTGLIPSNRSVRENIIFSLLILLVLSTATLAYFYFNQPTAEKPVNKFIISLPKGVTNMQWPVISPDGKQLAFVGNDTNGVRQVWIRPMHSLEAYPLADTDGALRPFWSPDSKQLAYFSNNQLKKIPAGGGPSQLICETTGADGHWGSKNIILFDNNVGDSIQQVSAAGGVPGPVTILNEGEQLHAWPYFLPDGEHFLYLAQIDSLIGSSANSMLRVASLDGSINKDLFRVATRIGYSPEGYIMYVQENTLMARKFDPDNLEVLADPVPIAEDIVVQGNGQRANFSISDNGMLLYQRGQQAEFSQIIKVNRDGDIIDTILSRAQYGDFSLSPDGKKLAYQMIDQQNNTNDIWVRDLRRAVSSRLTFDDNDEVWPIWSPDGKSIIYSSNASGEFRLQKRMANGLGEAEGYFGIDGVHMAVTHWSGADNFMYIIHFQGQADIWRINETDTTQVEKLLTNSTIFEGQPQLSPDGRFLAYGSNETGQQQVYIRDLSSAGGKWQVSSSGGHSPRWREDGHVLFYFSGQELMSVPVNTTSEALEIGIPEQLFDISLNNSGFSIFRYFVTANGEEFLFNVPFDDQDEQEAEFITVLNWSQEIQGE